METKTILQHFPEKGSLIQVRLDNGELAMYYVASTSVMTSFSGERLVEVSVVLERKMDG